MNGLIEVKFWPDGMPSVEFERVRRTFSSPEALASFISRRGYLGLTTDGKDVLSPREVFELGEKKRKEKRS